MAQTEVCSESIPYITLSQLDREFFCQQQYFVRHYDAAASQAKRLRSAFSLVMILKNLILTLGCLWWIRGIYSQASLLVLDMYLESKPIQAKA